MSENHFHRIWTLRAHRRLKNIAMVCRVQGSGFRVLSSGCRVQGAGRLWGLVLPFSLPNLTQQRGVGHARARGSKGGMYLS